jgi:pimeloyl-ACP methyl ester carboxylesterase
MKKIFLLVVLVAMFLCGNLESQAATKAFQCTAKDGFNITGTIYIPVRKPGKKAPIVILLHAIGSSKKDWKDLPDLICSKGYACLALDLRGHGQSIYNAKMKQSSWLYFTNRDFGKYPDDVICAVEAVKTGYAKQIDTNRIIFVGNNIGANTAILAGSKLNRKGGIVRSIVMISPRLTIKGMFVPIELVNYGAHPILIFDNKNVKVGMHDTFELKKYAQGNCVIKALNAHGMGASLYKSTPSIKTDTLNWIVNIFK